ALLVRAKHAVRSSSPSAPSPPSAPPARRRRPVTGAGRDRQHHSHDRQRLRRQRRLHGTPHGPRRRLPRSPPPPGPAAGGHSHGHKRKNGTMRRKPQAPDADVKYAELGFNN